MNNGLHACDGVKTRSSMANWHLDQDISVPVQLLVDFSVRTLHLCVISLQDRWYQLISQNHKVRFKNIKEIIVVLVLLDKLGKTVISYEISHQMSHEISHFIYITRYHIRCHIRYRTLYHQISHKISPDIALYITSYHIRFHQSTVEWNETFTLLRTSSCY